VSRPTAQTSKPPHKRKAPQLTIFWRRFWSGVGQKNRLQLPGLLEIRLRLHPKVSDSLRLRNPACSTEIQKISEKIFSVTITRKESRIRHCWSKWFLKINRQTYDLMLVIQTETIVSL